VIVVLVTTTRVYGIGLFRQGGKLAIWYSATSMAVPFKSLDFTDTFLETFGSKGFSAADRRAIRKALRSLDSDEQHPSLRVHQLKGDLTGLWSASASDALRLTFVRTGQGRKTLVSCSRHYDRSP
jgi:mRNA-degrading endonuclease YafQ of YafQ-DinJ toxin-antitoxin module